ncbi:hypothetical protein A9Q81_26625 [Gammaproteobacteria bacterium 42_54_T18]|nr:hypothetical protein A9Q81_26625 [Gammaproteobacteria bacterium 42_54_T18]
MTKIKINSVDNSIVVGGAVNNSSVSINNCSNNTIFDEIYGVIRGIEDDESRTLLELVVGNMKNTVGTSEFSLHYKKFMSAIADHVTILLPFATGLAQLIP